MNFLKNQYYSEHDKTHIKSLITSIIFVTEQLSRSVYMYDTFVVLFKHRFVMQPSYSHPLCSRTDLGLFAHYVL